MTFLEKSPSDTNSHSSASKAFRPETKWTSAKTIVRFAVIISAVGIALCSPMETHVLAKAAQAGNAKSSAEVDPDAMKALETMGTYLRSLKSFQVDTEISSDDVLDDGQIVTDSRKDTLLAARPNRLRVELKSDDKNVLLFYDGKNFTVYGKLVNYYATVPAPPTIGELISKVDNDYGIEIPLVDLFMWGTDQSTIKKITSAMDLGPSTVNDITCEHYAFRQDGLDWQIWIQLGDFPLPRKIVIRTLTDDARPEHTSILKWNLAPSYNDAAFTFDPPDDAKRIAIKDLNANGTKK